VAVTSDEIEILIQNIISVTCKYFNLDKENVMSKKRNREFMAPRYFIIYLIREKTNLSLKSIGKIVNRDHTTCIYAIDEIRKQLTNPFDDTYSNDLKKLKSII
jgi:chromosomal replication initiator protein